MILCFALLFGSCAWAGDHDRARSLLEQGEVLALSDILKLNHQLFAGKILAVELEEKGRSIVYEIKLLGEHGVVKEALIDAHTGKLISVKED